MTTSDITLQVRSRNFSLMTKFSLILLVIVFSSAALYAGFSAWQFKNDKLKYIHLVNSTFTQTIGQKLRDDLHVVQKDLKGILLIFSNKDNESRKSEMLLTVFKNNSLLVSLKVYRLQPVNWKPGDNNLCGTNSEQCIFKTEYSLLNNDFLGLNQLAPEELESLSVDELRRYRATPDHLSISDYFFDRYDKNLLFYVYPISDDSTLYTVLSVSKEFLHNTLSQAELSDLKLVKKDGQILSAKIAEESGLSVAQSPLFKHALTSQINEGSTEFSVRYGQAKEEFMGNFYKITEDLILLAQVNKSEAFAGLNKMILNSLLFGLLTAAISIIIGVQFSRSITLPLRKLMSVTEDIAAGRYNVQTNIQSSDEVGQLADYFTILGQRLSEREEQLEQAIDLANKDGMTGVFNHRHFRNKLTEYFNLAKRYNKPLSLILTDIDFFKKFNDTYGHQQGDQVIKDIAKILTANARETDFVARYGGEEFVVILPETDLAGATHVAERIRLAYQNHKILNINDGSYISSTCSLGVATYVGGNFETIDQLIEHADQNLYKAKQGGRNQVVA